MNINQHSFGDAVILLAIILLALIACAVVFSAVSYCIEYAVRGFALFILNLFKTVFSTM